MTSPLISIVITTKNEEKHIENCLKSIKLQIYENIEIIVVDNQSNDKTKEISRKYTNKVFDKWPERSAQRNLGMIDKSSWKYVMYVDADMIFAPNLIQNTINFMENNNIDAVYVPEIILWNKFWSKVRRFERSFYDGTVIDCCRVFKKQLFKKIWGFDMSMSGPEDWDIDKKARNSWNVKILPQWKKEVGNSLNNWDLYHFIYSKWVDPNSFGWVIYHNESEFDLKQYLQKKWYYAQSFDTYTNKWWKNDPDIKKQFWVYYRFLWVFTQNWKRINLLKHPILTFWMYFLRFLVWVKYIFRNKNN